MVEVKSQKFLLSQPILEVSPNDTLISIPQLKASILDASMVNKLYFTDSGIGYFFRVLSYFIGKSGIPLSKAYLEQSQISMMKLSAKLFLQKVSS